MHARARVLCSRAWSFRSEKKIQLNSYEARIARELVDPQDIRVDFSSIGGLEDQKNEIQALVVDRFRHPDIFGKVGIVPYIFGK